MENFSQKARGLAWQRAALFSFCLLVLSGCDLLEALRPSGLPHLGSAPEAADDDGRSRILSPRENFAFQSWVAAEMIQQVFARQLKDKSEPAGWANVLTQKGSIEGVYHGLVLSNEYAALEDPQKSAKVADIAALRFYGQEMAMLDHPSDGENDPKVKAAAAQYVQSSMTVPLFTLKRELGERILHEASLRKGDKDKLAAWYASFASRWAKLGVSFGLAQRNDQDEVFHFNWAKDSGLGMLEWELLNREHRIMNQLGGVAVPAPKAAAATIAQPTAAAVPGVAAPSAAPASATK